MTNSRVSFPEKEVRAHWRNVFIVLFLLASPFILYISYIIWVEIAIPEFSAPKESVKVFHIPGGDIPTKRDISYYRSYWQSNYYTQVYVSELGYDETIALISRRSSKCEMRDSDPSQRPFFVATPVMQCFQSALPEGLYCNRNTESSRAASP